MLGDIYFSSRQRQRAGRWACHQHLRNLSFIATQITSLSTESIIVQILLARRRTFHRRLTATPSANSQRQIHRMPGSTPPSGRGRILPPPPNHQNLLGISCLSAPPRPLPTAGRRRRGQCGHLLLQQLQRQVILSGGDDHAVIERRHPGKPCCASSIALPPSLRQNKAPCSNTRRQSRDGIDFDRSPPASRSAPKRPAMMRNATPRHGCPAERITRGFLFDSQARLDIIA